MADTNRLPSTRTLAAGSFPCSIQVVHAYALYPHWSRSGLFDEQCAGDVHKFDTFRSAICFFNELCTSLRDCAQSSVSVPSRTLVQQLGTQHQLTCMLKSALRSSEDDFILISFPRLSILTVNCDSLLLISSFVFDSTCELL